jgi:hypothetical protein
VRRGLVPRTTPPVGRRRSPGAGRACRQADRGPGRRCAVDSRAAPRGGPSRPPLPATELPTTLARGRRPRLGRAGRFALRACGGRCRTPSRGCTWPSRSGPAELHHGPWRPRPWPRSWLRSGPWRRYRRTASDRRTAGGRWPAGTSVQEVRNGRPVAVSGGRQGPCDGRGAEAAGTSAERQPESPVRHCRAACGPWRRRPGHPGTPGPAVAAAGGSTVDPTGAACPRDRVTRGRQERPGIRRDGTRAAPPAGAHVLP